MAELLLVNPRRRRKARKTRSRGRRRMSALQRKYFGGGRKRHRRTAARAVNPRRRRRSRARLSNPHRRSRRSLTRSVRRRRRNPSFRGGLSSVQRTAVPMLKAGLIGATGALGLDLLWGYTSKYLPATIAGSPLAQYAAKLLGAVLVGMIGDRVPLPMLRGKGRELATGAATVVLHDAMKAQFQATFPTVQLGEYLTYAPSVGVYPRAGQLLSTGMGEYLSGLPQEVGYPQDSSGYYGDGDGDFTGDGMSGM